VSHAEIVSQLLGHVLLAAQDDDVLWLLVAAQVNRDSDDFVLMAPRIGYLIVTTLLLLLAHLIQISALFPFLAELIVSIHNFLLVFKF